MERAARRPELVERPIIYGICHLRRREGAGGTSRPVALPRPAGRGRSDDPLLGRLTQQQTKDQFPVLLEYAKAFFEGIKQRLRHL
jgi:hypothetical protein